MADQEGVNEQPVNDEAGGEEEKSKLDCQVTVEDSGPWKKKLTVVIPRAEIDKELDKEYRDLRETADVPGFRKGRAPRRLVEKRFGENVRNQAKLRLMAQAFEQIEEEHDFEVLGEPDFDPDEVSVPEEGDLKFDYEVEIKPQFELPPLEGVRIEKPLLDITPERVNQALEQLRQRRGRVVEVSDGAAADDMLMTDVEMTVEGVEEPEQIENRSIRVGATVLANVPVENLSEVVTGAKVGDEFTCQGTAPDSHPNEAYRNKPVSFQIKVKEVHRLVPAELNAAFFESLGVDNEDDLRREIEESLEDQADREQRNMMRQQVYRYLGEKVTFDLPEGVVVRHAARVLQRRYYDLMGQGVSEERIQEHLEQLQSASKEEAAQELKMSFIMEQVADKLDLTATDSEVNGYIAQIAARYNRRPERIRDEMAAAGRLETVRAQIRDEKAIDRILEMAEVVDAPEEAGSDKGEAAPSA